MTVWKRWIPVTAGLLAGAALFAFAPRARSQLPRDPAALLRHLLPDPRVWKGKVVVHRIGSQDFKEDRSRGGAQHTEMSTRTVNDSVTIEACGATGSLYVKSVSRALTDISEHQKYDRKAVTTCAPSGDARVVMGSRDNPKPEKHEPGSWTKTYSKSVRTLVAGKGPEGEHREAFVKLDILPGGEAFRIAAAATHASQLMSTSYNETFDACTGKTERTTTDVAPSGGGMVVTGDGDNLQILFPPTLQVLGMAGEGQVGRGAGGVVAGAGGEEKEARSERDYGEKTDWSWSFTGEDPCPKVFGQFLKDLVMAEAYANKYLQESTDDREAYDDQIDKMAGQIACRIDPRVCQSEGGDGGSGSSDGNGGGEDPGAGGSKVQTDMEVRPRDCIILHEQEFRRKELEACNPPVIADSIIAHEKKHVSQCKTEGDAFRRKTPRDEGRFETEAYLVGIAKLLNFLDTYCDDYKDEVEKYRPRVKHLRQRLKQMKAAARRP